MLTPEEHIDNLVRHIRLVQDATILLGKRLMRNGRMDFGRKLIARGFVHDASKFHGIEWDWLHCGNDVPKKNLEQAVKQHVQTNEHHPEAWGSLADMPEIAIAEMICDWYARAQEFGTGLREWIDEVAVKKYKIKKGSPEKAKIDEFLDILLQNSFVEDEKKAS